MNTNTLANRQAYVARIVNRAGLPRLEEGGQADRLAVELLEQQIAHLEGRSARPKPGGILELAVRALAVLGMARAFEKGETTPRIETLREALSARDDARWLLRDRGFDEEIIDPILEIITGSNDEKRAARARMWNGARRPRFRTRTR